MKSRNSFSPLRVFMVALLALGLAVNNAGFMSLAPTTAYAGSINVDLDQWANLAPAAWQNGDLNGSNSSYGEGRVVPFRLAIEGLSVGTHTINLNYDWTAGGHKAYDFLASYDATEASVTPCTTGGGGVSSLCPSLPIPLLKPFPVDTHASSGKTVNGAITFANVSRNMTAYGVSDITFGAVSYSGSPNSTEATLTMTFTTTGSAAFFLWGGHLAQSVYWDSSPNGSGQINGAPWHMRTQDLDGSGNKNQDRSIQPSALVPAITVAKTADAASVTAGSTIGFSITVTNSGPGSATNVTLSDPLPTAGGVSWSINPAVTGCTITGSTLSCTWASLAQNASQIVHVTSSTTAASCGTLPNTATANASNGSGTATSNQVSITVTCPSGATLTLVKTITNDNGGTAAATAWTLTATGPQTITGTTGSGTITNATIAAGTYALSEIGPIGYTASSWVCVGGSQSGSSITLAAGQSATCTINNDDNGPALHLRKTITNDNGGTAAATAWTLTATGTGGSPTNLSGSTPVDSGAGFKADTYALGESGPSGYTPGAWDCGTATMPDATHVTVPLGGNVTCTITNDDIAPKLTLAKHVNSVNGGTADASAWTLTATGSSGGFSGAGSPATGPDANNGPHDVTAGVQYTLSESGPSTYTAVTAWVCTGGGTFVSPDKITLSVGEDVTCTITNSHVTASLALSKAVTNAHGGTATPADFTLTASGPTPLSGAGAASGIVLPGTYALSETGPSGYASSGWTCTKNEGAPVSGSSLTLANGDSAFCTIENTDIAPVLHLRKVVSGGTAAATAWTLTASGTGQTPTNLSGSTPVDSGSNFNADTYTLAESVGPAGYTASSWVCVGGTQNGSAVTLGVGQSATCTITNTFTPTPPPPPPSTGTLIVLKYNDLNGNGTRDNGEPMLGNVTFSLSSNGVQLGTLVTDTNGSAVRTGLGAGSYTLVETVPSGWYSTDPGGSTPSKTATVNLGGTTTVVFGNKQITIPPTTIGGTIVVTKYEDANRNKQRDASEGVLSGWTFTVRDSQGALVATITTAANGTASAANLAPGTYTVSETVQTGWVSTDPGGSLPSKTLTIAAGQTVNVAFGNAKIQLPSTSTAGGSDSGTTLRVAMLGLALLLFALQRRLTRARRGLASAGSATGKGGTH